MFRLINVNGAEYDLHFREPNTQVGTALVMFGNAWQYVWSRAKPRQIRLRLLNDDKEEWVVAAPKEEIPVTQARKVARFVGIF